MKHQEDDIQKRFEFLIGIDPDLHKSGFATYEYRINSIIDLQSLYLWDLFNELRIIDKTKFKILLEYPDNTNTYHKGGKGAALNVGKNQAVAIIIKEFLEANNYNYELKKQVGYSKLFKDKDFFIKQTGYKQKSNEDSRAAAAIVWINK